MSTRHLLILGGTGEAAALARGALARFGESMSVTTALAGRTRHPGPIPGQVRIGGFGGAAGLAAFMMGQEIDRLIDATHPFAAEISRAARLAASRTGIPRLSLRRPPWQRHPLDRWIEVDSVDAAAALVGRLGRRAWLTVGAQAIPAFAPITTVRFLVRRYTREAGVRNLEREIASLIRRDVAEIAGGKRLKRMDDVKKVRAALGKRRFYDDVAERIDRPGVATGLVWTPTGGEIIFVEATLTPGKGELKLTGQLGEVMKESAAAALSYLKSRADDVGIDRALFDKNDIHVHVPAGAVPKDGPSAGITMATALVSLARGKPVSDKVAMTGEITLTGQVLPIGGVKEKVLGAHRAGLRRVLVPSHNLADLDDIPADLRKQMQFVMLESIDQVLREALAPRKPVALNGNGARTTVVARAAGSSRARQAPPSRRGVKGRRRPVA